MKITIINVSDNDKHFKQAIEEYLKRLGKDVKIIDIKPEKNWSIQQIKRSETEKIIKHIDKNNDYKIVLSIDGHLFNSIDISKTIENKNNITFIIWWPYWLDEELLKNIDSKWSFWKITLPHWLAKLTLLEQIFRAKTIIENKNYHY